MNGSVCVCVCVCTHVCVCVCMCVCVCVCAYKSERRSVREVEKRMNLRKLLKIKLVFIFRLLSTEHVLDSRISTSHFIILHTKEFLPSLF